MEKKVFFCLLLWVTCIFGCVSKSNKSEGQLYIVATTAFLADAAKEIVADSAKVDVIMGPGVDPHLYKATQGDLQKFLDADVIFFGGLHLEGKMTDVLKKLGRTKSVYGLGDELPSQMIRRDEAFSAAVDPHIWFDVRIWQQVVALMASHLMKIDPKHAVYYKHNAENYTAKLSKLHEFARERISSIPAEQRIMITAHDAFHYFGDAYGIEVRGLQGLSTTAEFGLKDIADLVKVIQERHIKAVFVETSVSDRALKSVISGVRAQGGELKIGGNLYSDAMGAPGTPEGNYIGMFTHNINTIVDALK